MTIVTCISLQQCSRIIKNSKNYAYLKRCKKLHLDLSPLRSVLNPRFGYMDEYVSNALKTDSETFHFHQILVPYTQNTLLLIEYVKIAIKAQRKEIFQFFPKFPLKQPPFAWVQLPHKECFNSQYLHMLTPAHTQVSNEAQMKKF